MFNSTLRTAAIAGILNGRCTVAWSGPISSLDAHAIATSRNREAPGLFSWSAGLVVHSAKLKLTSGSGTNHQAEAMPYSLRQR